MSRPRWVKMIHFILLLFAFLIVIDGVFQQNSSKQLGHLLPIVPVKMTAVYLDELSLFALRRVNRLFLKILFQIVLIYYYNWIRSSLVAVLVVLVLVLVILVVDHLALIQYLNIFWLFSTSVVLRILLDDLFVCINRSSVY